VLGEGEEGGLGVVGYLVARRMSFGRVFDPEASAFSALKY
jgi:hypothetical protein